MRSFIFLTEIAILLGFRSAPMYYRGAQVAILVYDITVPASFIALKEWAIELQHNALPDLMVVICGNKSDLGQFRRVDRSVG